MQAFLTSLSFGLHLMMASAQTGAPPSGPQPGQGRIERVDRIDRIESKYVEPRHVDVWLPAGYSNSR